MLLDNHVTMFRWRRLLISLACVLSCVIFTNIIVRVVRTAVENRPWFTGIRPSQPRLQPQPQQQWQDHKAALTLISREHQNRRDALTKFCSPRLNSSFSPSHKVAARIRRYFAFSDRHRLVYCAIQKVGTSFWLRVMRILVGRVEEGSLFRGSFEHSHRMMGKYSFQDTSQSRMERAVTSYRKFLFVRDPYSRLFSAYVDKIFLPNYRALRIAQRAGLLNTTDKNEEGEAKDDVKGQKHALSSEARQAACLLNVSFADFLGVITSHKLSPDPHWYPMHRHCDPCAVGYDYVGRMETFKQDVEFILNDTGVPLGLLSGDWASFHRENDLVRLTDLARSRYNVSRGMLHCHKDSTSSDAFMCLVMRKIWIALQTRGLISVRVPYPFPRTNCLAVNEDRFVQILVAAFRQSGSREARMRQREEAMMEAYSGLPRWLLKQSERYVHDDCVMFGYTCDTRVRFPEKGWEGSTSGYSYFGSFT